MEAVDIADFLSAAGLEGPSEAEALIAEHTFALAEVFALGASLADLDPRAAAGIEFLFERVRTPFTTPALATDSKAALDQLWRDVAGPVLRLMDAITVCLYEATRAQPSKLLLRRFEHTDRSTVAEMGRVFEEHSEHLVNQDLQEAMCLVETARRTAQHCAERDRRYVKMFHTGILIWALGVHLCAEAAARLSSMVDDSIRPNFASDAVEFVRDGARLAALAAISLAGVRIGFGSPELSTAWANSKFASFMLRATVEIPRVFGPEVHYQLDLFRYPDEPDAWELHVIIDPPATPEHACDLLDQLCDSWWDEAATGIGFGVHPVLGVLNRD